MFKLQVQDDDNDARVWHDVRSADGRLLTFDNEAEARAKLEELYPVLVKLERYSAGSKRTLPSPVSSPVLPTRKWPRRDPPTAAKGDPVCADLQPSR